MNYIFFVAIQIAKIIFYGKIHCEKKLNRKQLSHSILSLLITSLLQLSLISPAKADFTNGGFEGAYSPSGTVTNDPITGWTLTGYAFLGNASNAAPTSISGINLSPPTTPGGITDIYDASNPTHPDDYFLFGAVPTPTLVLPGSGLRSASVNLRSGHAPFTHAGGGYPTTLDLPEWDAIGSQATSITQSITIQQSDIDPIDHKVHVRFIAAPVLDTPVHPASQQPFFAIQLNNLTTDPTRTNPLYFQWNFSSQPGVPWKSSTTQGINNINASYKYTDWQSFDVSPGNAYIHVGDTIELVALASGCSPGGHDGHLYIDDVGTAIPSTLWVFATGPTSTTPGSDVTYTYHYSNGGSFAVNHVAIVANLPQGTPGSAVIGAQNTTYVSNTNPTTGSCTGTAPVTCNIGTLQPGESGTFTVTVNIPGSWVTTANANANNTSGPVNNGNYPISGDGVTTLLGPLVPTTLVAPSALSNLIANTSGMPTSAVAGTPYTGSFTCANSSNLSAAGDAPNASCDIANLPAGLAVSQCTVTPSSLVWTQPANIPAGETVTCDVTGTPTATGTFIATVTTDSSNNSNSTTNHADATIAASAADMVAASSLPASGAIGAPYSGSFTCTNNSAVTATGVQCGISGLPNGVTKSSCSSPTHNPWVNGSSLPAHQAVTCAVSGTPRSIGSATATVTTNSTNQVNTSNDTRATTINVRSGGVADIVAAASLPAKIPAFGTYSGSFTCTNNSSVTANSVQCNISGLPSGVKVSSCSSPSRNPWVNGSSLPAHQAITCKVSGNPQNLGSFSPKVMAAAINQSNTSNDNRLTVVTVSRPPVPATLNGSGILSSAVVCCGRPVLLNNLGGVGKTIYKVSARTGDASCVIGLSGSQAYLKMYGRKGSCTVVGTKNGITTLPLTIRTP